MGILTDVLGLLRRPATTPPISFAAPGRPKIDVAEADTPLTEGEVVEALQRTFEEYAAAEATISAAEEKRDALLLQEGTDAAIVKLDRELAVAKLLVERLDKVQDALRAKLVEVRQAVGHDRFAAFEAEYLAVLETFYTKFEAAIAARDAVLSVWNKAQVSGLPAGRLERPAAMMPLTREALAVFKRGMGAGTGLPETPVRMLHPLIVTDSTYGQYQRGESVGMTAAEGWKWVALGMARWADPLNIPPKPPEPAEPQVKVTAQDRLDRVFSVQGGR
jgi:hypothetical protein